nr:hypothetical protein Iba_chr13dCG6460 [Ipomoea batatas]
MFFLTETTSRSPPAVPSREMERDLRHPLRRPSSPEEESTLAACCYVDVAGVEGPEPKEVVAQVLSPPPSSRDAGGPWFVVAANC